MEPQAFVAEVYRRMQQRSSVANEPEDLPLMCSSPMVRQTVLNFRDLLPQDKNAPILDIGFGKGWFIASAITLGYQNIFGAEYRCRTPAVHRQLVSRSEVFV